MTTGVGGAEPDGPTKLTIINAVNDYDAIRVCFQPYPSGPAVLPWPASAAGLAFPKASVVDPAAISPSGGDVQPYVLAGDLAAIAGKSCDEALALAAMGGGGATSGSGSGGGTGSDPPIVAAAMPILPGAVFSSKKSLLLAFYGCLGGPGHDDGTAQLGCGFMYTPATPTASLTLVAMSRKTLPTSIAFQFLDASVAMQPSDIRITPGFDNSLDVTAVHAIALGGLAPKPPFFDLPRTALGPLSKVALKTFAPNDSFATSALFMQDAFVNGGIKDTELDDGKGYTFVALGGYPGVNTPSFWKAFTYTLIKSDP